MLNKVIRTIQKHKMIKSGDTVLVAVSGGPDSVCLLDVLYILRSNLSINLAIAHLDHMMRGKASANDARFVERLASKYKVPFCSDAVDVNRKASLEGKSLEEAGRDARYEFLKEAAGKIGAGKIAIGHTKDDQAETVLMRILRGSGLKGLGGIPPTRKTAKATIIRPLIDIPKDDIAVYLKEAGLRFRLDSTNKNTSFKRNKIRNELLPLLEENYNKNIKEVLAGMADNMSADYLYIRRESERILKKISHLEKGGGLSLKLSGFSSQSESLKRHIVRCAIEAVKGDLAGIEYRNWRDIDRLIGARSGSSLDLDDGIIVLKEYDRLVFVREGRREKADGQGRLPVPGELTIDGLRLDAKVIRKVSPRRRRAGKLSEDFDYDKLEMPLLVRYRRPGDTMRPLGMKGRKKIKDIFIDKKIPRRSRCKTPIVISGKEILWVPGVKVSDYAKISKDTSRIARLSVSEL